MPLYTTREAGREVELRPVDNAGTGALARLVVAGLELTGDGVGRYANLDRDELNDLRDAIDEALA